MIDRSVIGEHALRHGGAPQLRRRRHGRLLGVRQRRRGVAHERRHRRRSSTGPSRRRASARDRPRSVAQQGLGVGHSTATVRGVDIAVEPQLSSGCAHPVAGDLGVRDYQRGGDVRATIRDSIVGRRQPDEPQVRDAADLATARRRRHRESTWTNADQYGTSARLGLHALQNPDAHNRRRRCRRGCPPARSASWPNAVQYGLSLPGASRGRSGLEDHRPAQRPGAEPARRAADRLRRVLPRTCASSTTSGSTARHGPGPTPTSASHPAASATSVRMEQLQFQSILTAVAVSGKARCSGPSPGRLLVRSRDMRCSTGRRARPPGSPGRPRPAPTPA